MSLDSYNAVWAKAQKGWDTKGWGPEDWEIAEKLWVHLLQNTMKEVKADPLLTKKLGTGGHVTRVRWEADRAARPQSDAVTTVLEGFGALCEADHEVVLDAVFKLVKSAKLVLEMAGRAVVNGVLR